MLTGSYLLLVSRYSSVDFIDYGTAVLSKFSLKLKFKNMPLTGNNYTLCLKKTGPLLRFEITPTNCA